MIILDHYLNAYFVEPFSYHTLMPAEHFFAKLIMQLNRLYFAPQRYCIFMFMTETLHFPKIWREGALVMW